MADRAAMGHGPDAKGQWPYFLSARWPRPQPDRSDPLAWRRGRKVARRVCGAGQRRSRSADQIPGVALTMKWLALVLATPLLAGAVSPAFAHEKANEIIESSTPALRPAALS